MRRASDAGAPDVSLPNPTWPSLLNPTTQRRPPARLVKPRKHAARALPARVSLRRKRPKSPRKLGRPLRPKNPLAWSLPRIVPRSSAPSRFKGLNVLKRRPRHRNFVLKHRLPWRRRRPLRNRSAMRLRPRELSRKFEMNARIEVQTPHLAQRMGHGRSKVPIPRKSIALAALTSCPRPAKNQPNRPRLPRNHRSFRAVPRRAAEVKVADSPNRKEEAVAESGRIAVVVADVNFGSTANANAVGTEIVAVAVGSRPVRVVPVAEGAATAAVSNILRSHHRRATRRSLGTCPIRRVSTILPHSTRLRMSYPAGAMRRFG